MGGLFEDLPPPSDALPGATSSETPSSAVPARGGWSVGSRMAPPSLMQPRQPLKPAFAPTALRRAQAQAQAQALSQAQTPAQKASTLPSLEPATPDVPLAFDSAYNGTTSAATAPASPLASSAQQDSAHSGASVLGTPLAAPNGAALAGASAAVVDEYDPARPNDYEEILRERKKRKAEEERERERERQRREQEERERERERELLRQRDIQLAMQAEKERAAAALAAAGATADSSRAVSGEDAWKRRALLSGMSRAPEEDRRGAGEASEGARDRDAGEASPAPARQEESGAPPASGKPLTAAERMMMKMGWKAGQGLGKQEQGITTPLMARKTDKRAGVIVNAPEKKGGGQNNQPQQQQQMQQQQQAPVQGSLPKGTPTKVVLLRNMVGPGEADGELEEEVAGECLKYGQVARVLIFEATDPGFPPHEAVRIFICFERVESAVKAAVDLDGRFFGGRPVRATYFSEERFAQQDLPPSQEELDQMNLQ